ncbi:MAG: lipopolysaccharide biosynthesis protein, partial [Candidatus Woesearchaeota archaeon]
KYMEPADYGIVYSLQVLVSVLTIAFTLSLPKAIFRLYYDYKTLDDKRTFISSIINTIFIISTSVFLLVLLFNNVVTLIYTSIDFFPYFLYVLIFILFNSFETVPKTLLMVKQKAKLFVILNVIQFLLKNGLIIVFVVYIGKGAEGYLLGQMLSAVILAPVFIYLIREYIRFRWNAGIIKSTLVFSLPMIPGNLSGWILNLSDRIFIERYFSTAEVGIYSLGYQIAGLVLIFSGAIKKAIDPHFYKTSNENNYETARQKLSKEFNYFIMFVFLIGFFIALFSKEAIQLFVDSKYLEAYKIVPIISLAYLIGQFSGYFNLMIYQKKKSIVVMYLMLLSALLNIGLNFLLIPVYGIYGAGWATVLSFSLMFILSAVVSRKYYYIPLNYKLIGFLAIAGAGIIVPLNYYSTMNVFVSLAIKGLILVSISVFIYAKYRNKIQLIFKKTK